MKIKSLFLIAALTVIGAVCLTLYFASKKEKARILEEAKTVSGAVHKEEIKPKSQPKEYPRLPVKKIQETAEDKEVSALIETLKSEDWLVVQQTEDKLVALGKRAVPKLKELVKKETPVAQKGQAIFTLGRIGDKEATPVLIEAAQDANAYIRRNAIEALGKIKDEEALNPIMTALQDEDSSVRERAASALGELGDSKATGALVEVVAQEEEESVKSAAIEALGEIKDQSATSPLVNELNARIDQIEKNKIVTALGDIGDPTAIPALTDYLNALKKGLEDYINLNASKEEKPPEEPIVIFQRKEAIRIAQEAIQKIEGSKANE